MGEAQHGGAGAVGGQFVAHHTVLDDLLPPLVFEHVRWIPHQDPAGHPFEVVGHRRAGRDHLDGAAFAGVDGGRPEPLLPFTGVGDGRPHGLDGVGQPALEVQHRAVTVDRECAVAPGHSAAPRVVRR
jgi:hypothetical protein